MAKKRKPKARKGASLSNGKQRSKPGNAMYFWIAVAVGTVAVATVAWPRLAAMPGEPAADTAVQGNARGSSRSTSNADGSKCAGFACLTIDVRDNGSSDPGKKVDVQCAKETTKITSKLTDKAGWRVFSGTGRLLSLCADLTQADVNGTVYEVPPMGPNKHTGPGHFVFPTHHVGYRTVVRRVATTTPHPITLTTLSTSPRVFLVNNFFSTQEADLLVQSALSIRDPSHKLKRSSTGATGYNVFHGRTSENAFDVNSRTAMVMKRRIAALLGLGEYHDDWMDGLQTLRYTNGTAYVAHDDYQGGMENHNSDPWRGGSNRFATLLLYLSDVDAGGQTVFMRAPPVTFSLDKDGLPVDVKVIKGPDSVEAALRQLEESYPEDMKRGVLAQSGSWERKLAGECQRHLAVAPRRGLAVLFYTQHPDGHPDHAQEHGACPVLRGTKWASNLWVWNTCRFGFPCAPGYDPKVAAAKRAKAPKAPGAVSASLFNRNVADAALYWEGVFMQDFPVGSTVGQNTYVGHRYFIRRKSTNEVIHGPWVVPSGSDTWTDTLSSDKLACTDPDMCGGDV